MGRSPVSLIEPAHVPPSAHIYTSGTSVLIVAGMEAEVTSHLQGKGLMFLLSMKWRTQA